MKLLNNKYLITSNKQVYRHLTEVSDLAYAWTVAFS